MLKWVWHWRKKQSMERSTVSCQWRISVILKMFIEGVWWWRKKDNNKQNLPRCSFFLLDKVRDDEEERQKTFFFLALPLLCHHSKAYDWEKAVTSSLMLINRVNQPGERESSNETHRERKRKNGRRKNRKQLYNYQLLFTFVRMSRTKKNIPKEKEFIDVVNMFALVLERTIIDGDENSIRKSIDSFLCLLNSSFSIVLDGHLISKLMIMFQFILRNRWAED